MGNEKNFENKVKRFLQSEGIYPLGTSLQKMNNLLPYGYYEKRWGSKFTKSGLPDLSISVKGRTVEVEIKAENGKPSELQKFMILQMRTARTIAIILYPDDFEDFKNLIKYVKGTASYDTIHNRFENLFERGFDE